MKILKNKSGLILAETLIAVAAMATGSIILGFIVTTANSNMRLSRDYLIVHNFAIGGIESVKNIRSTNRLREPNDKSCWLTIDPDLGCGGRQAETGGNYKIVQEKGRWKLEETGQYLDLESSDASQYRLYIDDSGGFGRYTTKITQTPSPYYRAVHFSQVDDDLASFEVKIQWKEGVKVHTFVQKSLLSNYL